MLQGANGVCTKCGVSAWVYTCQTCKQSCCSDCLHFEFDHYTCWDCLTKNRLPVSGPLVAQAGVCAKCHKKEWVYTCRDCQQTFCDRCARQSHGHYYCPPCLQKRLDHPAGDGSASAVPLSPSPAQPSTGAQAQLPQERGVAMEKPPYPPDELCTNCGRKGGSITCQTCRKQVCALCVKYSGNYAASYCPSCFPGYGGIPAAPSPSSTQPSTGAQAQQAKRGATMGIFQGAKQMFAQPVAQPQTVNANGVPLTTSDMTQEQLRVRRIARVESAKVARPLHEALMLFALKIWLVLGPPAFVALTVFEVSYIFQTLLPPGDSGDKIIFFGALFVDLAMMFTTFGVAIKRRDLAEKREIYGSVPKREEMEVWFGTGLWLIFAAINVIGQSAFLLRIVQGNPNPGNLTLIYLFIAARVTGFILGDACTAFFLAKVDSNPLKLIARSEREKGIIYADIANAEGKRQIAEAEAEASILIIQLEAQQKKEDAEFLAALKRRAFASALGETPSSEPTKSRVYRGNT